MFYSSCSFLKVFQFHFLILCWVMVKIPATWILCLTRNLITTCNTIQSAALNFDRNRNHSILPSDKTNALVLLRRYWGHQQIPTMCSPNNKRLSNHLYQNNWKISHQDLVDKVTRVEVDLAHLKAWPQLKVVGHLWRRNTSTAQGEI